MTDRPTGYNQVHPEKDSLDKVEDVRGVQQKLPNTEDANQEYGRTSQQFSLTDLSKYLYYIPVVNVIYDVIGGHIPDFGTIKSLVETNGVVAALIYSISMSLPYTMTYEDWDRLHELFDEEDGAYYDCSFKYDWLVATFTEERNNAILYVLLALIIILIVAIEMNVSELQEENDMLLSWWNVNRWVIFSTFILEILSITATMRSLVYYTVMMVPNPYVLANGCSSYDHIIEQGGHTTILAFTKDSHRRSNTWAYTARSAWIFAVPLPALSLLTWSFWIISEAKRKNDIDAEQLKKERENDEAKAKSDGKDN